MTTKISAPRNAPVDLVRAALQRNLDAAQRAYPSDPAYAWGYLTSAVESTLRELERMAR